MNPLLRARLMPESVPTKKMQDFCCYFSMSSIDRNLVKGVVICTKAFSLWGTARNNDAPLERRERVAATFLIRVSGGAMDCRGRLRRQRNDAAMAGKSKSSSFPSHWPSWPQLPPPPPATDSDQNVESHSSQKDKLGSHGWAKDIWGKSKVASGAGDRLLLALGVRLLRGGGKGRSLVAGHPWTDLKHSNGDCSPNTNPNQQNDDDDLEAYDFDVDANKPFR
ncbi:hypothetical protein OPV22_030251 [Ensete ventricosum]|uniref:Uncharacterized protein n=1 Tax=Ensete ventricosum TaxID=4639 RepID=A0AAV8Q894_ENSVE|nr:hypothetical protein OPV22_030251 [Ensete ventricosum]